MGNAKVEAIAGELSAWSDHAVGHVQTDPRLAGFGARRVPKRVVIVDISGSAGIVDALHAREIEVMLLRDLFTGLVRDTIDGRAALNEKHRNKDKFWGPELTCGKDDDTVRRLVTAMRAWDVLRNEVTDRGLVGTPAVGAMYECLRIGLGFGRAIKVERASNRTWTRVLVGFVGPDGNEVQEVATREQWLTWSPRVRL